MSVIPEDDVLSWAESLSVEKPRPKKKDPVDSTAAVLDEEFTALGYPGTSRLSILGDVGRENNWDRNTIFKGHSDPKNQSYNRGIISWQGDRRTALDNFLKKEGVLGRNDDEELRGMARFMDKELREKFPDVHQTLLSPKSTYDASEALRRYIKYVPDAPYNSPDPEFRVKNNAEWAKRARKLGLGQELDLNAIWGDVDSVLTDPETVWNEVEAVVDDKPIVTPTPTVPGQKPLIAPGQPLVPDPNDVPTQQAQDEPIDTTRLTRDIGELEKLGTAIQQGVEYGAPQIAPRVPRPVVQQPVTRNKRYVGEEPVISDVDEPTTNLTQANVTREGLYDAVALTIDYPEGADPVQYVIQELKRRFPEGDFSKFELLDRNEGAIGAVGAVVTYGALKDAGIDLTGEEVARQRTETPTPDLSLRGAPIFSESSESEADLREKFRKEEIAKYTDPTTLDFWLYNLTSSPFTRASDVFSPPTKESIEKTVDERIAGMPSAGEGRRATETYNPEADFPLATVPARLGAAAYKGFVVDNFAPFLETGGIAQSAFKRYVLGDKTSEAKDTDLFKSGQVMRQTHEQGLPKGTGGIDEKFARGLGQAAGTIMLMAATGGLGGAARTGATKVATSALDEIAIGASGIADNIAKSTLKTAAGKMLNPQMLRGAVVGVAQQASQAYEMAKSKGATEDQAMLASLLSAPGGFVEGLSESTLVQKLTRIQKLDAVSDGLFSKGLMGKAKEIAKTGHSVGVSELWEEMLQGVNSEAAKAVYESRDFKTFSQDVDKSVRDSLLAYPIGFVIGGAGAIGQEIGTREPEAKEKVETFPQTGIWFNERKGTEHPVTVTRVVGVGQRTGETIYETDSGEHILESEFRPDQQKVDLPSNKKAPKTKAETPTGDLVSKEIPPADVESGVSDDVSGDTEEGARIISREVPIGDLVMGQDTTEFIYSPAKPQPPAKDADTQETKAPSPDTSPIRSRTREKVKGLIGKKIAPADVESSASSDVSGEAKVEAKAASLRGDMTVAEVRDWANRNNTSIGDAQRQWRQLQNIGKPRGMDGKTREVRRTIETQTLNGPKRVRVMPQTLPNGDEVLVQTYKASNGRQGHKIYDTDGQFLEDTSGVVGLHIALFNAQQRIARQTTTTARDTRKTQETKDEISQTKPSRSPALEARKQRAVDRKAERAAKKTIRTTENTVPVTKYRVLDGKGKERVTNMVDREDAERELKRFPNGRIESYEGVLAKEIAPSKVESGVRSEVSGNTKVESRYGALRAKDQKDYIRKTDFLKGYLALDKEFRDLNDRTLGIDSSTSQYAQNQKALDKLDNSLRLQAEQGAKYFGMTPEDFIGLVNEYESDKTAVKKTLAASPASAQKAPSVFQELDTIDRLPRAQKRTALAALKTRWATQRLFYGTDAPLTQVRPESRVGGVYLTRNPKYARKFGRVIAELDAHIARPYDLTPLAERQPEMELLIEAPQNFPQKIQQLRDAGHDSITYKDQVLVLDPSLVQLKASGVWQDTGTQFITDEYNIDHFKGKDGTDYSVNVESRKDGTIVIYAHRPGSRGTPTAEAIFERNQDGTLQAKYEVYSKDARNGVMSALYDFIARTHGDIIPSSTGQTRGGEALWNKNRALNAPVDLVDRARKINAKIREITSQLEQKGVLTKQCP